jgi:hypothetical protein
MEGLSLLHRRWAREKKGGHNGNVGIDSDGCLSYGDRHSWKVDKMNKFVLIAILLLASSAWVGQQYRLDPFENR